MNSGAVLIDALVLVAIKGSVLALTIIALAGRVRVGAGAPRRAWPALFAMMAALPLAWTMLPAGLPTWIPASVSVQHARFESPLIGALTPATLVIGLWLTGVAIVLLRLARAWAVGRLVVRDGLTSCAAGEWKLIAEAAKIVGIREPRVAFSEATESPAVFGWRDPVVLLPVAARSWPRAELRAVLCHELAHVRDRDWLAMILESVAAAIYWPNPLLRRAWRAAAIAREIAADRAALRSGISPAKYAARMIAVARACSVPSGTIAFVRSSELEARVKALFEVATVDSPSRRVSRYAILCVAVASVMVSTATVADCVPSESGDAPTTAVPD
jgi:beta-lactamase regulating signal transducer with metallopeptidase domain